MSFRDIVCAHLAQYKQEFLRIKEDGPFNYRGQNIPQPYILPITHYKENILDRYRTHFFSSKYAKIKLHRFFHHLNSSQALCINLFYPLIAENQLGLFLQFLGIEHAADLHALFEKESDIENARRRTSFDFFIKVAMTSNIFVEVKYTEFGFGQANNDKEHSDKFYNTYHPLVEKSLFLVRKCKEKEFFLKHYQILRNLVHIGDDDHVVLLFPFSNAIVFKEAIYARDHILTEEGRAKLKIVFLEDIVSFLEVQSMSTPLTGYYEAFRTKYMPLGMPLSISQ
ncbi:MAG: hypothetical protein CSYNP_03979 [Syntrophus sp. SKADARSKE-3]|nr:hypothetical protein [Syntrophus sp. SKADARSKE-3]